MASETRLFNDKAQINRELMISHHLFFLIFIW
jgi:hypothetical protein